MQAVEECDMVIAMYRDRNVPMKLYDFEHTVNVTLDTNRALQC